MQYFSVTVPPAVRPTLSRQMDIMIIIIIIIIIILIIILMIIIIIIIIMSIYPH